MENNDVTIGISIKNKILTNLETKETKTLTLGSAVKIIKKYKELLCIAHLYDFEHEVWSENVLYSCNSDDLIFVDKDIFEYIVAIDSPILKIRVAEDIKFCKRLKYLKKESKINLALEDGTVKMGIIKYIGKIKKMGPGNFIGVELIELYNGQGNTDGKYLNQTYFNCFQNCGVFVTVDKLNLNNYEELNNQITSTSIESIDRFEDNCSKYNGYRYADDQVDNVLENNRVKSKKVTELCKFYENNALNSKPRIIKLTVCKLEPKQTVENNKIYCNGQIKNKQEQTMNNRTSEKNFRTSISGIDVVDNKKTLLEKNRKSIIDSCAKKLESDYKTCIAVPGMSELIIKDIQANGFTNFKSDDKRKLLSDYPKSNQTISPSEMLMKNNRQPNHEVMLELKKSMSTSSPKPIQKVTNEKLPSKLYNGCVRDHEKNFKSAQTNFSMDQQNKDEIEFMELIGVNWPSVAGIVSDKNPDRFCERNRSMNPLSHVVLKKKSIEKRHSIRHDATSTNKTNSYSNSSQTIYDTPERSETPRSDELIYDSSNDIYICDDQGTPISRGSLVEISIPEVMNQEKLHGVVRYLNTNESFAGIELDEPCTNRSLEISDGEYKSRRYFTCAKSRGLFVPLVYIQADKRFHDKINLNNERHSIDSGVEISRGIINGHENNENQFGTIECPVIPGFVQPLTRHDVKHIYGKNHGIQGHHNSCYLDATLFSMFSFSSVFDSLLYRPRHPTKDIEQYSEVQTVLRDEIVNPLRKNGYVRADRVMKLRRLLNKFSSVTGLTSEEKDPEEFLNSLVAQILREEPYIKLSSGQDAYYYQLFVEKDENIQIPTVQRLFEQSILASNIRLREAPSCLIIQMPRFGKSYKMYPRIIPSPFLDVTDVIENSPRQCIVCGKLADKECLQCFGLENSGLEATAFCDICWHHSHVNNPAKCTHRTTKITIQEESRTFLQMLDSPPPPRLIMELFAVVCIETSHYVSFVKCGSGPKAPWCFFDSMADRKGEQNGYNIPEIVACPDLKDWLDQDQELSRDNQLPEYAKRLLCDAYLCLYQNPTVKMYR